MYFKDEGKNKKTDKNEINREKSLRSIRLLFKKIFTLYNEMFHVA